MHDERARGMTESVTGPQPAVQTAARKHAPNRVVVRWQGEGRFDTGRPSPGSPVARIDSSGETGQSPVDALLSALATCASVDVVEILKKRRTPAESLEVEVIGTRAESIPRRLEHVLLRFRITGAGIERDHAERAIDLAVDKYCSVRDSLAKDIGIEWTLELGNAGRGAQGA